MNSPVPKEATSARRPKLSSQVLACLVIFAVAFGLRWAHLKSTSETVYPEELAFLEDARYYASWSEQIADGQLIGKHSFFMGPLYPYSLAAVRPLAGRTPIEERAGVTVYDFDHVYWLQALFGALACVLVWILTQHLLGTWQAWVAGLLAASQRVFIYFDGLLMPSSQTLFVIVAALALVYLAMKVKRPIAWWACGIGLGLAALAKAPSLLLVPGVALWVMRGDREQTLRARWQNLAFLLLGCLPVIGLATAHNYAADGDFVLITSNAGSNLWIGNGPNASGAHAGVTTRYPSAKLDFYRFDHERGPDEPPASVVSRELSKDAREYMAEHPAAALGLLWKKFRMFCSAVEVGTTDQFEFFKRFSGVLRVPFPGLGWIGPLGLLGLVLTLGRWRKFWPLQLLVVSQAASFSVFFMLGRYRLASVACLIVLAVAALDWGVRAVRERKHRSLSLALLGLVLTTLLVHWPIAGMGPRHGFANQHYLLARHAESSGSDPLPHYLKALEGEWRAGDMSLRQQAVSHLRVGDAHRMSRRPKRARAEYELGPKACDQMSPNFRYRQQMVADLEGRLRGLADGPSSSKN